MQDTEVGVNDVEGPLHVQMRAALDPDPNGVFGLPNLQPRPPLLAETTTSDNTACALVHVAGGALDICERGLGDHPWAANAQPVTDEWPVLRVDAPTASGGRYQI